MPLSVISCCTYLTDVGYAVIWRPRDYDANDFVKAVKARPINGYCQIPCRGSDHRIDDANRDLALTLFAQMITDELAGSVRPPVALLPVPNSRCDLASGIAPRTAQQAEALARELGRGFVVLDMLRWARPLLSASAAGGTRDPQFLFDQLRILREFPPRRQSCILVDDVLTTGGHLQACAALLRRHGQDVELATVTGRADRTQVVDPFATRIDILADFTPHGPRAARRT